MPGRRRLRPLVMPKGMKELIRFSLEPLRLQPPFDAEDVLAYRVGYESGLVLTAVVLFVRERKLLFLKRSAMSITVADMNPEMTRIRCHYMQHSFRAPTGPHDMQFAMEMLAEFTACTRAVADELKAGERVY